MATTEKHYDIEGVQRLARAVLKDAIETYNSLSMKSKRSNNEEVSASEVERFFADSDALEFWLTLAGSSKLTPETIYRELGFDPDTINPTVTAVLKEPPGRRFVEDWDLVEEGNCCALCKKSSDGCRWSKFFQPVPGWIAAERTIEDTRSMPKRGVSTYKIYRCPEFVPENPKEHIGTEDWDKELCDLYVRLFEENRSSYRYANKVKDVLSKYRVALTDIKQGIMNLRNKYDYTSDEYRILGKALKIAANIQTQVRDNDPLLAQNGQAERTDTGDET